MRSSHGGRTMGVWAIRQGVLSWRGTRATPNTVATDRGPVRGTSKDGVRTWLGIPYASVEVASREDRCAMWRDLATP